MKKIYAMIFVAAATLAGCQNVNDGLESDNQNKVEMKVGASVPTVNRTALTENAGVYKATWKAGDALSLVEIAGESVATYESAALAGDTESANFSFELTAAEAESYTYLAVYPKGAVSNATANKFVVTLPATQSPAEMNTFDGAADILVSNAAESTVQGGSLALTMQRLSAVGKITVKNMPLAAGEVVKSVTFSCGHPLAGSATVKVDDLTSEVKQGIGEVKVVLPESQSGEFTAYFSCLPATLAAGDAYTVSVETSAATYHKVSTVTSPLTLAAGDITTFSVNMGDAASKTTLENFDFGADYAIGVELDGKVHLLPVTACNRRPVSSIVGEASDLLNVKVSSNGTLSGEISKNYRWTIEKNADGTFGFYSLSSDGDKIYLIGEGTNDNSSGLAIKAADANGVFTAQDGSNYVNTFDIVAREDGGYDVVLHRSEAMTHSYVYSTGTQWRLGKGSANSSKLNFYQIKKGSVESVYPVITKAAHVTEGTYVILSEKDGNYYALPNEKTWSTADETTYAATPPTSEVAENVAITINNGVVTAADVDNKYKWVITLRNDNSWTIASAVNKNELLWQRNANTGIAIGEEEPIMKVKDSFKADWTFFDDATYGMQAQTTQGLVGNGFYLYMNGSQWRNSQSAPAGGLVLVKLSNSTDEIATE